MSLKSDTFILCKKIWELKIREPIKKLIRELNISSGTSIGGERDRSNFGYIARQQIAQFLGYIIVDEKRAEIEKSPYTRVVPILSEKEIELLRKAHFILEYLDGRCTSIVTAVIPNSGKALDPYSQFSYSKRDFNIAEIVDQNIFTLLISAFHSSDIVQNILSISPELSKKIPASEYFGAAFSFIKRLERCGVHDTPEDFKEIKYTITRDSAEYLVQKLLFSVMCLRKILTNINQLLHQAFLSDKLIVFNEDNIVDIVKYNHHHAGEGITLLIQPLGNEFLVDLGDIVLVKCGTDPHKLDKLCMVEGISTSFNNEFGTTQVYKLRVIDDNLNPFFGFLDSY